MARPLKPPHQRQRRNKTAGATRLPTESSMADAAVPPLPEREGGWRPEVLAWWESVWRSPMASQYLDADVKGGLLLLADLHQARWLARDDPKLLLALVKEIARQEPRFGLSPLERMRLGWEVEREEPAERPARPAAASGREPRAPRAAVDPRELLKAVG